MAEIMNATLRPTKLEMLTDWMATQRWYAAKGRTPSLRRLGGYRLDDPAGEVGIETLIVLDDAGPEPVVYQVPLTYRSTPLEGREGALLGTMEYSVLGTRYVYDGPHDPLYAEQLLALAQGRVPAQSGSVSHTADPAFAARPRPASEQAEPVEVISSKVLRGEQSNTSIVYEARTGGVDTPVICKVFRMLHPGENPDVVLQNALAAAGSDLVPRPVGDVSGEWADPGDPDVRVRGDLAFAQEFLPGTQDAWRVALAAAEAGTDFTDRAHALGAATAAVHELLARELPTAEATDADRAALAAQWRARAATAVAEAPQLIAQAAGVTAIADRAEHVPWPALQRVHGDYHLGQVLDVPGRGWVLLDFEGEPLRPLDQRSVPDLALRDVAGMLRSFDYVAGSITQAHPGQARTARAWADAAQAAFLDGYASVADDPRTDPDRAVLLAALTLDKALYEVVYEARNRPTWLSIPVAAVEQICATATPESEAAGAAHRATAATAAPDDHPRRSTPMPSPTPDTPGRDVGAATPAPATTQAPAPTTAPADPAPATAAPISPAASTPASTPATTSAPAAAAGSGAAGATGAPTSSDAGTASGEAAQSGPMPVDTGVLDMLARGGHGDPHAVLGAHPYAGGVTVRALRPMAQSVVLELPDGTRHPLQHEHEGVWVVHLDHATLGDYRLLVTYGDGVEHRQDDPYRFWPTLGEVDLHLIGEGRHEELWKVLGSHVRHYPGGMEDVTGTSFAVWAPNARAVRVVGEFNRWDGQAHPMRALGSTGVWELFVPGVGANTPYKYEILGGDGYWRTKADPLARATECPPATASVVTESGYQWHDQDWMAARAAQPEPHNEAMSVYECHLGSWRQGSSYVDLAEHLVNYVKDLGFTHVEFMPVMEHPYGPSWGYQVTGYYAPTSRFGSPDEFRYLVDRLHQEGIGVILDWVPAHFPKDAFALAKFDGQPLYEHPDPRRGDQPDWGTHIFDFGRPQVRNFLVANASYWIEEFHVDGLRVDAVASMLYLDYSRNDGEWLPNQYGGREHLEAVQLLQEMNATVYRRYPGAVTIAEESTSWPGITKPTYMGGLGFGLKWNMGWMHDTLSYVELPPIYRQYHHHQMTFAMVYQYSENFTLPISHDEVVYGKGSMLRKMPGDRWEQLAGLRAYYAFMWSHPGKQLLFMGQEFAQEAEWADARSLDWWLLDHEPHWKMHALVKDLNHLYASHPAMWELDNDPAGFAWIDANDAGGNTLSFLRYGKPDAEGERPVLASIVNFSGGEHHHYRVGLPKPGPWREVLNTDSLDYGGAGVGNLGQVTAEDVPWHGQPYSALITLPKLGAVWFEPADAGESAAAATVSEAAPVRAQTQGVDRPELASSPVQQEEPVKSDFRPSDLAEPPVGTSAGAQRDPDLANPTDAPPTLT